jgi:enoyl-CoA hydratase/carnithine racemase
MTGEASNGDISIRLTGPEGSRVGRITLTRPKALNALTYDMAMAIENALDDWAGDEEVAFVLIDGEGDRAFCAGGDIADLYNSGKSGDFEFGRKFWSDEYRMNAKIGNLALPYVAIMDGIVMGGGVGISAHGSDRIVTGRSMIAMPECGIGLIPDVGGSKILANAPGHLGEYLGTTGYRMGPGDAVLAGFADIQVDESAIPALISKLEESGELSELGNFARPADPPQLSPHLETIEKHFSKASALECVLSLEAEGSDWAREAAKQMRRGCPLSVACTFELIRRVRKSASLEDALAMEYRFTFRSMSHGEFIEGVRAQIIDKDRNPQWKTARLEDVTQAQIDAMLAPLDNVDGENRELVLEAGLQGLPDEEEA